jgi:hypothetical protein
MPYPRPAIVGQAGAPEAKADPNGERKAYALAKRRPHYCVVPTFRSVIVIARLDRAIQ